MGVGVHKSSKISAVLLSSSRLSASKSSASLPLVLVTESGGMIGMQIETPKTYP